MVNLVLILAGDFMEPSSIILTLAPILALALHFAWYNVVRIHRSLRITPAMAAGVTERVWELGELLA